MPEITSAYALLKPSLDAVAATAGAAIRSYANERGFLTVERVKTEASLTDKLQTGRYAKLLDVDDMVAFSIIVDTRNQVEGACKFLQDSFVLIKKKHRSSLRDETVFAFDATRMYLKLGPAGKDSPLKDIIFEVQVRTILQHSWSKITHPLVYKSTTVDPRKIRLSAEMLAALETLDREFSTFNTTAKYVKRVANEHSARLNKVVGLIDKLVADGVIPSEFRPRDGRRLADNILSSIDGKGVSLDKVLAVIDTFFRSLPSGYPTSLDVFEIILVALTESGHLRIGKSKQRSYYISDTLKTLYPVMAKIGPQVAL